LKEISETPRTVRLRTGDHSYRKYEPVLAMTFAFRYAELGGPRYLKSMTTVDAFL